jgi:prophage regulatory protein
MIPGELILERFCPTVLIEREEVLRRTSLKKSTMYVLISKGEFPAPVRKSNGRVGWIEAEVEGWIQKRAALRLRKTSWEEAAIPIRSAPTSTLNFASRSQQEELENQPPRSIAQEIRKMSGRSGSQLTPVEPKFRYDFETGELWLRVIQLELPNGGSDQKRRH